MDLMHLVKINYAIKNNHSNCYSKHLSSYHFNIGIVSLLFCGIILKHYAYDNMSLKTKRTTKYIFHVLAKLSENFIFVYLGLTLFTNTDFEYKLYFILFTSVRN